MERSWEGRVSRSRRRGIVCVAQRRCIHFSSYVTLAGYAGDFCWVWRLDMVGMTGLGSRRTGGSVAFAVRISLLFTLARCLVTLSAAALLWYRNGAQSYCTTETLPKEIQEEEFVARTKRSASSRTRLTIPHTSQPLNKPSPPLPDHRHLPSECPRRKTRPAESPLPSQQHHPHSSTQSQYHTSITSFPSPRSLHLHPLANRPSEAHLHPPPLPAPSPRPHARATSRTYTLSSATYTPSSPPYPRATSPSKPRAASHVQQPHSVPPISHCPSPSARRELTRRWRYL